MPLLRWAPSVAPARPDAFACARSLSLSPPNAIPASSPSSWETATVAALALLLLCAPLRRLLLVPGESKAPAGRRC